jgi:predicted DNA-binding WGR domain protein
MCSNINNNNNKYFILQALEMGGSYFIWTRYGRVGYDGVSNLEPIAYQLAAEKAYSKIYRGKRKTYNEVLMALGKEESKEGSKIEDSKEEEAKTKLD